MKHILIFSKDLDSETNEVIRWLRYYGPVEITRLNGIDYRNQIEIDFEDSLKTTINGREVRDFDAVWYRKYPLFSKNVVENPTLNSEINDQQSSEIKALYRFMNTFCLNQHSLGSKNSIDNNKLENLAFAKMEGFDIPIAAVLNSKAKILEFMERVSTGIIAKPISNTIFVKTSERSFGMYTEIISKNMLELLPDSFQPTLFQSYIKKKYEIRAYYLKGKIYASAIFSKEASDIRKDSGAKGNRIVPITLSDSIQEKIKGFMKRVKLDSGSLDLIMSMDGGCYFLEVNPFGQLKQFSDTCGYELERKIAEELMNNG